MIAFWRQMYGFVDQNPIFMVECREKTPVLSEIDPIFQVTSMLATVYVGDKFVMLEMQSLKSVTIIKSLT